VQVDLAKIVLVLIQQHAWRTRWRGFYYSPLSRTRHYPEEDQNNFSKVYLHNLDTPQADDQLIYEQPDAKELSFTPFITHDGKYLFLDVWHGSDAKNRFYYREVASEEPFIRLLDEADAGYYFMATVAPSSTSIPPRMPLVAASSPSTPASRNAPTGKNSCHSKKTSSPSQLMVNQQFVVAYMHNAYHRIMLYTPDGTFVREIPLPTLGSIIEVAGKPDQTELFISLPHSSIPLASIAMILVTLPFHRCIPLKLTFDANTYETKQAFYASKDGHASPCS